MTTEKNHVKRSQTLQKLLQHDMSLTAKELSDNFHFRELQLVCHALGIPRDGNIHTVALRILGRHRLKHPFLHPIGGSLTELVSEGSKGCPSHRSSSPSPSSPPSRITRSRAKAKAKIRINRHGLAQ